LLRTTPRKGGKAISKARLASTSSQQTSAAGKATKKKEALPAGVIADAGSAGAMVHPFDTDPADHCETPQEAYEHLAPFLKQLAKHLKKPQKDLVLYDPYYCEGSMRRHLQNLGYDRIYNKNEDFYAVIEEGRVPDYDILVTSPPYSRNHMQKLAAFCASSQKPWALLLPSFVHRKQYWQKAFPAAPMVWVIPQQRYHYWSICGGRQHNLQICRHWARDGRCKYKDKCAFLHNSSPLEIADKGEQTAGNGAGKSVPPPDLPSAPADVPAGSTAPQNVSPHLLSPYNSLWHIHIPERPCQAACSSWSMKGATLAVSLLDLTAYLATMEKATEGGRGAAEEVPLATAGATREMTLEEAREAERGRVLRKRRASEEAQARRQRAAIARQLESGTSSS